MSARKASAQTAAPVRLFTHFTENGVVHPTWYPTGTERNFTLNKVHKPFEPLKQNVMIFDGLTITQTGGQGSAHMRAKTGNLTAWPNKRRQRALERAVHRPGHRRQDPGPVAAAVHRGRRVRAGQLPGRDVLQQARPGGPDRGRSDQAVRPGVRQRHAQRGRPPPRRRRQEFKNLWMRRKSVIDSTMVEYKQLTIGPARPTGCAWTTTSRPSAIWKSRWPRVRAAPAAWAAGHAECGGIGDFVKEFQAQQDILLMAIACDITRVANLHYLTNKVVFSWVGADGGTHHDHSHRQKSQSDNLPQLDAINTWYATQVVYIVDRLRSMPDVDGRTVFDNTIIFWANELAIGSHKFERAPYMLVAGKFPLAKGWLPRDRPLPAIPEGNPAERPAVQPGPGLRLADHQLRPPDVAPRAR